MGGKRKATAASAVETERAEKRRREVQWAHVRAAMCGVLGRVCRKRRGKRREKEQRTSHTPGTATAVHHNVQNPAVAVSRVRETACSRPKRGCKDLPPGTYAPVKRFRGTPPGQGRTIHNTNKIHNK